MQTFKYVRIVDECHRLDHHITDYRLSEAVDPRVTALEFKRFRSKQVVETFVFDPDLDVENCSDTLHFLVANAAEQFREDAHSRFGIETETLRFENAQEFASWVAENAPEGLPSFHPEFDEHTEDINPLFLGFYECVPEGNLVIPEGVQPAFAYGDTKFYSLSELGYVRLSVESEDRSVEYVRAEDWEVWCGGWDVNRIMSGVRELLHPELIEDRPEVAEKLEELLAAIRSA